MLLDISTVIFDILLPLEILVAEQLLPRRAAFCYQILVVEYYDHAILCSIRGASFLGVVCMLFGPIFKLSLHATVSYESFYLWLHVIDPYWLYVPSKRSFLRMAVTLFFIPNSNHTNLNLTPLKPEVDELTRTLASCNIYLLPIYLWN
jgi:hypothetical protein